ncbi:MAG: ABC transporter ATP-binding protein, partial [Candidatus Bathyarchaeia archaeon]
MPLLRVSGLVKRFGGLLAINNVSFDVDKGEYLGLIGPNGSGKTTIFNLICGFLKPDKGTVIFKDTNITRKSPHLRARMGIGRTFQIVKPLLDLSVLDNVTAGALMKSSNVNEAKEKAQKALELVGLYDKMSLKARSLNIVQRKRLELARALAMDPELLLLDEIAAGLTPTEVDGLLKILRDIHESGKTIIMVEHVMRAVMTISERVIVLHHGEKIAEGTPKEVSNDQRVIEVYLGA